jgi:hypothetical protein
VGKSANCQVNAQVAITDGKVQWHACSWKAVDGQRLMNFKP